MLLLNFSKGMGGTHHAISQVIEYSGWLLEEIAQYAAGSKLSKDMKRTLNSFQKYVTSNRYPHWRHAYLLSFRELKNLQNVVKKISTRGHITRFFLYDADIQAITACTTQITAIYDKLEVRPSLIPGLTLADGVE